MFSCDFNEVFKSNFFTEHIWVSVSELWHTISSAEDFESVKKQVLKNIQIYCFFNFQILKEEKIKTDAKLSRSITFLLPDVEPHQD